MFSMVLSVPKIHGMAAAKERTYEPAEAGFKKETKT